MHPKLKWVSLLTRNLSLAMPGISFSIEDTVDPLKKTVILQLGEPLVGNDYSSVQRIVHAFANANDCTISKIRKGLKTLEIEVCTKTRLGSDMTNNPFLGDKGGAKEA